MKNSFSNKEDYAQYCNRIARAFGVIEDQELSMAIVSELPHYLISVAETVADCREQHSVVDIKEFMKRPIVKEVKDRLDDDEKFGYGLIEFLSLHFHFVLNHEERNFNPFDYYLRLSLEDALELEKVLVLTQEIEVSDVYCQLQESRELE